MLNSNKKFDENPLWPSILPFHWNPKILMAQYLLYRHIQRYPNYE